MTLVISRQEQVLILVGVSQTFRLNKFRNKLQCLISPLSNFIHALFNFHFQNNRSIFVANRLVVGTDVKYLL